MGTVPARAPRRRKHFNVFGFIGMVVFLCGVILAVGVFVYKDLSQRELESTKAELQEIKNSFSQSDIQNIRELDRRIKVANVLLAQHLAPSMIFDMLEARTQEDISFTEFSYERRPSGSVEMVLNGEALRFNTVALQGRQFASAAALESAIFSDINVGGEGGEESNANITFTVTSELNESAIGYTALPVSDTDTSTSSAPTTDDFFENQLDMIGTSTATTTSNTP